MITRFRTTVVAVVAVSGLLVGCGSSGEQAATPGTASSQDQSHPKNEAAMTGSPSDQLHQLMMRPMQNMSMTGNPDKDFATMMAEHHQQGIDMAKVEVEHGKNDQLKAMAQSIMDTQAKEIEKLTSIASGLANESSNKEASDQMHMVMMQPMSDMSTSGDVDKDFAKMMAAHHEMAIKMAEIEVKSGSNSELKEMAKKMADAQSQERTKLLEFAK